MSVFIKTVATCIDRYVDLRRSLGFEFRQQAATLRRFLRYLQSHQASGPA